MRLATFLLIAIALSISVSAVLYIFLLDYHILEKREIPLSIQVTDFLGFDLDNSSVKLGACRPGDSSSREIQVTNEFGADVKLEISISGSISKLPSDYPKSVHLKMGESKAINFKVSVPGDMPHGNYTGMITLVFKRL